jgi:hypothetical protein
LAFPCSKQGQRCGFCGEPVGATDHPGNQTNCPKKAGFGEYIDAKKNKDVARVKLARIIEGREVNFSNLSDSAMFSHRRFLSSPPTSAKRVQIKGYCVTLKEERYYFCTCISAGGKILSQAEGTRTVSYEDVFIEYVSLMAALNTFDFVFLAPLKPELVVKFDTAKTDGGQAEV